MPAPTATVEFEPGQPRTLRLDVNGLCRFEEVTGKNLLAGFQGFSLSDLRAAVWAFLLHEDPALTLEQAGALLEPGNIEAVTDALLSLFAKDTTAEVAEDQAAVDVLPTAEVQAARPKAVRKVSAG